MLLGDTSTKWMDSILLRVDQSERRWDVRLPNGISAASKRVAISAWYNRSGAARQLALASPVNTITRPNTLTRTTSTAG